MIPLKIIKENPTLIIERLKVKNFDATELVNKMMIV